MITQQALENALERKREVTMQKNTALMRVAALLAYSTAQSQWIAEKTGRLAQHTQDLHNFNEETARALGIEELYRESLRRLLESRGNNE